jgi:beta-glucosidase
MIAGTCSSPVGPGGNVTYSDGSDLSAAAAVAKAADVAIVFVATSSSEGSDRPTLAYGNGQDGMH